MEAFEGSVFAFGSVTADKVVAGGFVEFGDHGRDVGGIVLEVAVEGGDELASGVMDAGVHGGALASVLGEGEDADAGAALDALEGGVGGAVVDEDEFVVDAGEGLVDLLLKFGDIVLLIVEGDYDGEGGAGGVGHGHEAGR